jgi:hypothetical protein
MNYVLGPIIFTLQIIYTSLTLLTVNMILLEDMGERKIKKNIVIYSRCCPKNSRAWTGPDREVARDHTLLAIVILCCTPCYLYSSKVRTIYMEDQGPLCRDTVYVWDLVRLPSRVK